MFSRRLVRATSASKRLASSQPYQGNNVLGIVREVYSKWERRSPLCPHHVKTLVRQGTKVLVQPSARRIFSDREFERAGAIVQEDISEACLYIGVKQIPEENIAPWKNHLFFSHVIKAQPENMPLLDTILKSNARLFDYEAITKDGADDQARLVAFGKYAGIAGMIDAFQGLGQRLLAEGYSTPFLQVPLSYMFQNLDQARVTLRSVGAQIEGATGLPAEISPLVFAFTGNGNVAKGAREIFDLMPHEWVNSDELPFLKADIESGKKSANRLYGIIVEPYDMVANANGKPLHNKANYYANPQDYSPIFHEKVAPYITVLVNCMYWDSRYPKLLTTRQIRNIRNTGNKNLRFLADITCDIGGSVEFFTHSTKIEKPFYSYSPESGLHADDFNATDIGVGGVDILPSELPRDASEHFGNALMPLLPSLLQSKGSSQPDDMADLPPELRRACIASHGQMQAKWNYITRMRLANEQPPTPAPSPDGSPVPMAPVLTQLFEMRGHVFDSGLLNRVLDELDDHVDEVSYKIAKCVVRPNTSSGALPSNVTLALTGSAENLRVVEDRIRRKVEAHPNAAGSITLQGSVEARLQVSSMKNVLLFGSGRVCGPVVKMLGSHENVHITIASDSQEQAAALGALVDPTRTSFESIMMPQDMSRVGDLVKNCDVAISLLPAHMHAPIAQEAIKHRKNMVTSSYVSPAMQALHEEAKAAGIVILNECGLDPGIDHMLIMQAINHIHAKGGKVDELISLCGGLPDPVAANNPFRYKFSWSPRGVLTASANEAQYLVDGKTILVPGEKLLLSASPSSRFPTMRMESLPNRNSLLYRDFYGIPEVKSLCRGTLRYEGWANVMYALKVLGLMDATGSIADNVNDWKSLLMELNPTLTSDRSRDDVSLPSLRATLSAKGVQDPEAAVAALQFLGILSPRGLPAAAMSPLDAICSRLEKKLTFQDTEKDMVAMYHRVKGTLPDGSTEEVVSSLLAFGTPGLGGETAMAATVGYTAGAAAELILQGLVKERGVIIPTQAAVYEPMLNRLKECGITWSDTITNYPYKK
jgi:alpha-aminoadipic semialdehyde synthase